MNWINCKHMLPSEPGVYFVFALSLDPDQPLYATAWWEPKDTNYIPGWQHLPEVWCKAITHWCKPTPP